MNSHLQKKIISYAAPIMSGLGIHKLFSPIYSGIGSILMFHRIVESGNQARIHNHESLEINPDHLRSTVAFFRKRGYKFYSLDEFHSRMLSGTLKEKFVLLTFDDGYLDNYELAYPILKELEVPFCIYITTNFPDRKAILWWYLLEDMLRENEQIQFSFEGESYDLATSNQLEKEEAFSLIRKLITQRFDARTYEQQLQEVFQNYQSDLFAYSERMAMSWEQIKEIAQDELVTIGAHTVNHFPLKQLKEEELETEIMESKRIIESHLGSPVHHFAYPFGKAPEADQREFDFIRNAGFKTAVTTRMSNIFSGHVSHMEALPRININRVSTDSVLKLQTGGMLPFVVHKGKKLVTT
ncbi:MAG: polysaccharide deacetylase family protein [Bacteroidota bacterium]